MKKLQCATLADALKAMEVNETCLAPEGYNPITVMKTCSELNRQGYIFRTSTATGTQTITRLK